MKTDLPLPVEKKLHIIFRLEPGCLGPDGKDYIEGFCNQAQKEVETLDADIIHWELIPRYDKSLPEIQYQINKKKLSHKKAVKYLEMFEKDLDELESHLNNKLTLLIQDFQKH